MNRYKSEKRSKNGFYVAVAVALLAAGGIARLSLDSAVTKKPQNKVESSKYSIVESESPAPYVAPKAISSTSSNESKKDNKSLATSKKEETKAKEKKIAANDIISFALPIKANIIKDFSLTQLSYSKTYGDMRAHTGIDIIADEGTVVKAAGDGTVSEVNNDSIWGNTVVIAHKSGHKSYYCGLKDVSVKKGEAIKMGKVLGTVGEVPSECLDKSHLHFAVQKDGNWVSPMEIISSN